MAMFAGLRNGEVEGWKGVAGWGRCGLVWADEESGESSMDIKAFLYLAALVVFAFGCRTFESRWIQKAGWVALLVASYLLGFWLTWSHAAGAMGVMVWFLLPALEIVGRVRKMRFPLRQEVKGRFAPSREVFPELSEMTEDVEACGYVLIEDAGWVGNDADHFARMLYHAEKRRQATITMDLQGEASVSYVSLTTRLEDGRSFSTTSFPFAPTMQFPPRHSVNRCPFAESIEELEEEHEAFLARHEIAEGDVLELDTEQLATLMEEEMVLQIDHNMERGLIEEAGEGKFRYSWRGCLFLWVQLVKEMVKV